MTARRRAQADRSIQIGHGLVQIPLDDQGEPSVAVGRGVFRIELNRPAQQGDGRLGLAFVEGLDPLQIRFGRRRTIGVLLGFLRVGPLDASRPLGLPFLIISFRCAQSRPQPRALCRSRQRRQRQSNNAHKGNDQQARQPENAHRSSSLERGTAVSGAVRSSSRGIASEHDLAVSLPFLPFKPQGQTIPGALCRTFSPIEKRSHNAPGYLTSRWLSVIT